jgi:signal transduction histidine kinase
MSHLAIVSSNPAMGYPPGAQAAHDLRNLLATIGLHLETLQRLSGPAGAKAADAAHALLSRCSALCNGALERAAQGDARARRKGVDVIAVARQVADLLAPSAPAGFLFDIAPQGTVSVLADSDEVFRILFNLMGNAVVVANRKPRSLKTVLIRARVEGSTVTLRVSDDGPGLPAAVRSSLFGARARGSTSPRHGHGLTIARELAERNGGTLTLERSSRGATFALVLPAFLSMIRTDAPASGFLSRRSAPFLPVSATASAEKS